MIVGERVVSFILAWFAPLKCHRAGEDCLRSITCVLGAFGDFTIAVYCRPFFRTSYHPNKHLLKITYDFLLENKKMIYEYLAE